MNSLKPDITTSQDLSLGAMSFTTTIERRFKLEQIIFHSDVPITETINISLDSGNGASYDTLMRAKSLSNESNFTFVPEGQNNFYAGDEIKITCTNANLTGTLYTIVKCSEVLI